MVRPQSRDASVRERLCCSQRVPALLAIAIALGLVATATFSQNAPGPRSQSPDCNLSIPEQPLATALQEFARQSGAQLVLFSQLAEGLRTKRVEGCYTMSAGLGELLAGSPLTFRQINANTFLITRDGPQERAEARAAGARRTGGDSASPDARGRTPAMEQVLVIGTSEAMVATRTSTPLREIPQTLSVLSREQMRQQNVSDISEALANAVGITAAQRSSVDQSFFARGYEITSRHYDGGAADNATGIYESFSTSADVSEFERIEVLRGADALFGADATPGATINMVRKRPKDAYQLTFDAWAGSWNDRRIEADITGPLSAQGALRGRMVGASQSRDFFYRVSSLDRSRIFGVLEYDLTPETLVTLGGSYQWDDAIPFASGLPTYSDGSDVQLPRETALAFNWSRIHARTRETYFQLAHQFSDNWKIRLGSTFLHQAHSDAYGSFRSAVNIETRGLDSPPSASFTLTPRRERLASADLTITGRFNSFGLLWDLAVGGDLMHFKVHQLDTVINRFGPVVADVFAFDPGAYPDPLVTRQGVPERGRTDASEQSGVYGALKVRFRPSWSVVAGARVSRDVVSTSAYFKRNGVVTVTEPAARAKESGKVTPYAGLVYAPNERLSAYASYTDIYQSQGYLFRTNGEPLKPADGVVIEAGVKGAWHEGLLNGLLAVYRIRQRGLPRLDPDVPFTFSDVPGCCYAPTNSTRSRGLDAELSGKLGNNSYISAGYTLNINHDPDGLPLSYQTPRHLFKLWTSTALPGKFSRFSVGASLHAQTRNGRSGTLCTLVSTSGCVQAFEFNVSQGTFAVAGVRAEYQMSDNWRVALNIDNLFDRTYYQTVGQPNTGNWYGEPRRFLVRLQGAF